MWGGSCMSESMLRIGVLFPEVLGTYGDTGNALVLRQRARWRGYESELVSVGLEDPLPSDIDLYLLGGGEDAAQAYAARCLSKDSGFLTAIERGVPLLAICAGLQILGQWYTDAEGRQVDGLGLLDCTTSPQGTRTIGELVSTPCIDGVSQLLTGFENHGGATRLGADAQPLGIVCSGRGNSRLPHDDSDEPLVDGVQQGSIIATYMHGPVLARNPQLADVLLSRALAIPLAQLPFLGDEESIEALRSERLAVCGISEEV